MNNLVPLIWLFLVCIFPVQAYAAAIESGSGSTVGKGGLRIISNIGHEGSITEATVSSDGRILVTGGIDTNIKVWDLDSGKLLRTLSGHGAPIASLALSRDGLRLISASFWCGIKIWDVKNGQLIATTVEEVYQPGGGCSAGAVSFSGDGKHALGVSFFDVPLLEVWDSLNGRLVKTYELVDYADDTAMTASGGLLVANVTYETVEIFNPESNSLISTIHVGDYVTSVEFYKEDSSQLIIRTGDETAIWSVATAKKLFSSLDIDNKISTQFSDAQDSFVAHWSADPYLASPVSVLDVPNKSLRTTVFADHFVVNDLLIDNSGRTLFVAGSTGDISLWDVTNGRLQGVLSGHTGAVHSLSIYPGKKSLFSASDDGSVKAWNPDNQSLMMTFPFETSSDEDSSISPILAVSPSGEMTGEIHGERILLRDINSWVPLRWLDSDLYFNALDFSPEGKKLVTGGSGVKVWDTKSGQLLHDIETNDKQQMMDNFNTYSVKFSPDGKTFASGSRLGVYLWDTDTGELAMELGHHDGLVTALDFSVDGKYLVSGSHDKSIVYWDTKNGKRIRTLKGHEGAISALSQNKNHLFSGSFDGTVKIWDSRQGKLVATMIINEKFDWLVITPEGFFNASENGADLLHVVNGMKVLPIMRIYDVFYRPDIVKAKLAGEDIRHLVGDMSLSAALDSPPPDVKLSLPSVKGSAQEISLSYEVAASGGGIGEIAVYQNGKLVYTDGQFYTSTKKEAYLAPNANKKEVDLVVDNRYSSALRGARRVNTKQTLVRFGSKKDCDPCKGSVRIRPIAHAENQLVVIAKNKDGTIASKPAVTAYTSTRPENKPQLWLLAVGINQFDVFNDLKNAQKDAEDFAKAYSKKASSIISPDRIHIATLINEQATKKNILSQLDKISNQAKPGDTFVWFVASHGMMDGNSLYSIVPTDLKCIDEQCSRVENLLNSNDILEASRKIPAMRQLLVLDTCHAGGLNEQLSGLYDARMSVLAKNMGLHLYASASATELAMDGAPGENSIFTSSLLASLRGMAQDDNDDTYISIVELGHYTRKGMLKTLSERYKKNVVQSPKFMHFGRDMPIYRVAD